MIKVTINLLTSDFDYQTSKEFDYFSLDCVNSTDHTRQLVEQMTGDNSLIVTTIQKLNTAIKKRCSALRRFPPLSDYIKKPRHETAMGSLRDKRIVFIFDECHPSQFGETYKEIVQFFSQAQMYGFTGTPILAENAVNNEHGKRTTKDLFEEPLHKYVITNAIAVAIAN